MILIGFYLRFLRSSRVGPNLVAWVPQTEIAVVVTVLLLPPARRWVKRAATQTLKPLHDKLDRHGVKFDELHARHDQHEDQIAAIHAKLDDIFGEKQP